MSSFQLLDCTVRREAASDHLTIPWIGKHGPREAEFVFPAELGEFSAEDLADASFALMLFTAMHDGFPMQLSAPISAQLMDQQSLIQEIAASWFEGLQEIPLEAKARAVARTQVRPGMAATFTSGVDSLLAALEHQHELDFLVYVQGYGPVEELEPACFAPVERHVRKVSAKLGKPLHFLWTDYRRQEDATASWMDNHGAALATIGLLLGSKVGTFLIPSSLSWAEHTPWGSSHWIDERWSTERVRIRQHGARFTRPEKIARLVKCYPEFVTDISVCSGFPTADSPQNCGQCEKCLRTMCALALAGYERWEGVFVQPLDLDRVRGLKLDFTYRRIAWENVLKFGVQHAPDHPALDAVRHAVAANMLRDFTDLVAQGSPLEASPHLTKLARVLRDGLWKSWSDRQSGWLRKQLLSFAAARPAQTLQALYGKAPL